MNHILNAAATLERYDDCAEKQLSGHTHTRLFRLSSLQFSHRSAKFLLATLMEVAMARQLQPAKVGQLWLGQARPGGHAFPGQVFSWPRLGRVRRGMGLVGSARLCSARP